MRTSLWLLAVIIVLLPLTASSVVEANGDDQGWRDRIKAAEANIPAVIEQYATSIGCAFHMEQRNIVPYMLKGNPVFVAVISLDNLCTGGSAMSRPVFVIVEHGGPADSIVVNAEYSAPHQTSEDFPQTVTDLFLKDGELWYKALEHDFTKDALCCPSVPVTGRVVCKNGAWHSIRTNQLP
jgi:hypothetical protein